MFQRTGAAAIKIDLGNIRQLCAELNNPEVKFPSVHVAGTNGKGSSSHLLAAVLESAGYKTGLYTSPHIKDFRERIRVNGTPITEQQVIDFVSKNKWLFDKIKPSFFELTVAMAFDYFAQQQVDIAIIEVGLGGRLDSTNIINPLVSLITNIGFDHSDILGNTLESIAGEKAGIIKSGVPVIIGERNQEIDPVFTQRAQQCNSEIFFAQDRFSLKPYSNRSELLIDVFKENVLWLEKLELQLMGPYQTNNVPGVLESILQLRRLGYSISENDLRKGFRTVVDLTGIKGRWQKLGEHPTIICDTGHNREAMEFIMQELQSINQGHLHIVLGFVNDKDISSMLEVLPKEASYYFCSANLPRSLSAADLFEAAKTFGLQGQVIPDTNKALKAARNSARQQDLIFVGGSTFVVAELIELI